jgi:hypothetical protein
VSEVSLIRQNYIVSLTYSGVGWNTLLLKMQNLRDEEAKISALLNSAMSECDERRVIQLREELEKIIQVKSKLRNALR